MPPTFMERNGYRVVAYRKFGDAGRQFNGHPGWANFAIEDSPRPLEIWVPRFGPSSPKSAIFGQPKELPREIGRGGTTAKLYAYDVDFKNRSDAGAVALRDAVQVNAASWWELQLYAMSVADLRGMVDCSISDTGAILNFSSQVELLKMIFRVVFEEELAAAKNLWTAGLSRDGLRKAARAFPSQGSLAEDPELEESLLGVIRANIALQEKNAQNRFSMRPTNAKRVLATGNFDAESRQEICDEFLGKVAEKLPSVQVVARHEALKVMNRSLRHCPDLALGQSSGLRQAASQTKAAFCAGLMELRSGDLFGDDQCLRFRRRLAERVDTYNVFTQPLGFNLSTASQPQPIISN
ncbi:CACNA1B [Symbiodinium sp. CCMP2456]|nr:CACNA1B [Symbiodinium sp. CCMP2456]